MEAVQKAKVFRYGSPTHNKAEGFALEQLFLQNQFWNALVEIDHEFNKRYHELRDGFDGKIKSLKERVENIDASLGELRQQINERRKNARSGKVPVDDIREKITVLLVERKPLKDELKNYREEVKILIKPQTHKLEEERKGRVKSVRQEFAAKGLYWGNYNAVADSYLTARSQAMKEGRQLRFHRFDGSGRWTCQIQGGMTIAEAFSLADNRFQIDPVVPEAWTHPSRAERRRLSRTTARIRIGSTEGRQPIWLEIPIVMHRPIPDNGMIKSVSIKAKTVSNRTTWFLNVTVVTNGVTATSRTGKVVAIDVGWRRHKGGLRVGYWLDSDGKEGEILLDNSFLQTDGLLAKLRQNRDTNFNLAKEKLVQWLEKTDNHPEWLLESTRQLVQWRACAHLAALVIFWRDNRFAGDRVIYELLENWRKQDNHLWNWQANLSEKMRGRRLEQYRILASSLVRQYDVILVEDFDLRRVNTKKRPDESSGRDREIRNVARVASISSMRSEIARACSESGKIFEKVNATNTTRECPLCDGKIEGSARPDVLVICSQCRATYDQDWAAAKNILKRWSNHRQ